MPTVEDHIFFIRVKKIFLIDVPVKIVLQRKEAILTFNSSSLSSSCRTRSFSDWISFLMSSTNCKKNSWAADTSVKTITQPRFSDAWKKKHIKTYIIICEVHPLINLLLHQLHVLPSSLCCIVLYHGIHFLIKYFCRITLFLLPFFAGNLISSKVVYCTYLDSQL